MQPRHRFPTAREHRSHLHRSGLVRAATLGVALSLTLSACGGDEEEEDEDAAAPASADTGSSDDGGATSATGGGEQDAGFGADGHWTAAQLCSLADLATIGALFPGIEVVESTGIDDPDASHCGWEDGAVDPYDPASNLFGISNNDHGGDTFSDSFERLDIPGSDQAVFAEALYSDDMSGMLVAVGDQLLTIEFRRDASDARDVAEAIAATWASLQTP